MLIDLVARWLWSTPTSAHHAPKSIPKRKRTKIEPRKGAPCTEIGPKIGAPHTVHQNGAQKRRTAHQKRPQKVTPCTEKSSTQGTVHANEVYNRNHPQMAIGAQTTPRPLEDFLKNNSSCSLKASFRDCTCKFHQISKTRLPASTPSQLRGLVDCTKCTESLVYIPHIPEHHAFTQKFSCLAPNPLPQRSWSIFATIVRVCSSMPAVPSVKFGAPLFWQTPNTASLPAEDPQAPHHTLHRSMHQSLRLLPWWFAYSSASVRRLCAKLNSNQLFIFDGVAGLHAKLSNTSTSSEARDLVHLQVLLKSLMLQNMYDCTTVWQSISSCRNTRIQYDSIVYHCITETHQRVPKVCRFPLPLRKVYQAPLQLRPIAYWSLQLALLQSQVLLPRYCCHLRVIGSSGFTLFPYWHSNYSCKGQTSTVEFQQHWASPGKDVVLQCFANRRIQKTCPKYNRTDARPSSSCSLPGFFGLLAKPVQAMHLATWVPWASGASRTNELTNSFKNQTLLQASSGLENCPWHRMLNVKVVARDIFHAPVEIHRTGTRFGMLHCTECIERDEQRNQCMTCASGCLYNKVRPSAKVKDSSTKSRPNWRCRRFQRPITSTVDPCAPAAATPWCLRWKRTQVQKLEIQGLRKGFAQGQLKIRESFQLSNNTALNSAAAASHAFPWEEVSKVSPS